MFDFLLQPVDPAITHAVAVFMMFGCSITFVLVTFFTLNKEDDHNRHKKSHKTKKA